MDWYLKILIFEFCNLQGGGGGCLDQKCEISYFFLIESFLPWRLLIWAWNFHFIWFEKFQVDGGGVPMIIASA